MLFCKLIMASNDHSPKKFRRRSIRLRGYDYSRSGAYFVSIVTSQRQCLFGVGADGGVNLTELGFISDECWRAIPEHFPFVELGAFVVMPNHVHGIITIRKGTEWRAPEKPRFGKPIPGSLGIIIRQYKSSVSRKIKQAFDKGSIWQRNYYERVIRDDHEFERIRRYIEANPAKWEDDVNNPVR